MSSIATVLQGEAGTLEGQAAVLSVMQNRAAINFGGYGTTVFAQANAPGQFEGRANPTDLSNMMTQKSLSGDIGDTTGGALYFVSPRDGFSYGGVDGATGPATAGILSGGNNIGGNYFSDRWGTPSSSFNNAFQSDAAPVSPDGTPLAGGLGPTVTPQQNPDGSVGGSGMQLSIADPNAGGSSSASGGGGTGGASGGDTGGASGGGTGSSAGGSATIPQASGGGTGSSAGGSATIPQAIDKQSAQMGQDTQAATKAATSISSSVVSAADKIAAIASATEKNMFSRGVMILVGALFIVGGLYMFGRATGVTTVGKVLHG